MRKLTLNYIGRDSWARPVYRADGKLYVDVNPCQGQKPKLCTKYQNDFDGEPDIPLSNVELIFIPRRDVWHMPQPIPTERR